MEEKILIKSEKYNIKKLFKIMVALGVTLSIILIVGVLVKNYVYCVESYNEHTHSDKCLSDYSYETVQYKYYTEIPEQYGYENVWNWKDDDSYFTMSEYIDIVMITKEIELTFECGYYEYSNAFDFAKSEMWIDPVMFLLYLLPAVGFSIIGAIIYLWLNSYNLTVSDKRVSGEVIFGKKVDLPIDSISATSITSLINGVSVSTSSGKISFFAIKNSADIHKVMNDLLIKRQEEKLKNVTVSSVSAIDEVDKIKKFKELLDSGIITQEEFDAKKKQLLGL